MLLCAAASIVATVSSFPARTVVVVETLAKASYDERWAALAKLLSLPVKKVAFNAQVSSWSVDFCSRLTGISYHKAACWVDYIVVGLWRALLPRE